MHKPSNHQSIENLEKQKAEALKAGKGAIAKLIQKTIDCIRKRKK